MCNTIAILNGFYCTNSPKALSVFPLWLYSCAKNLPRYPSCPLWAFLLEICTLNQLWPSLDQKRSALDICHPLWIGLTRIWSFIAPLHLFKPMILSEPRSCEKKISIITWSCSLRLGIIGKDKYSCILKWCSDFQSIFVHESGARCPHFAKSSISGFCGVPS